MLQPHSTVALVVNADRLCPPTGNLVVFDQESSDLAVLLVSGAPPVQDREPPVPLLAGGLPNLRVGHALVGRCEARASGLDAITLPGHLAARGRVALTGLGYALAHAALERLVLGHNSSFVSAAAAGLTLPWARPEGVLPSIPRAGPPLPR